MSRGRRIAFLGAVAAAALVLPGVAQAAPWCGTTTNDNRPFVATGSTIRVFYAYPADGVDRSAELAPQIWSDIEEIDAWWRANDPTRAPNFDLARFDCGTQVDLTVRRLTVPAAQLEPAATRFTRIRDDLFGPRNLDTFHTKYLLYYDGPVEDEDLCGEGGGEPSGGGLALVYLHACPGTPRAAVAVHEVIHAIGALFRITAPNACPGDLGHICDGSNDILAQRWSGAPLASLVLDAGRNDYYGHSHGWFDVQDSRWLRRLDQRTPLSLTVRGRGTVVSDVPGVRCTASCRTDWNPATAVILLARPAAGHRFVGWSGGCAIRAERCDLLLDRPTTLTAVFAPSRYRLTLQVAGRGRVTGAGASCGARRCVRNVLSHQPLALRAVPAPGWRLRGWTGACRGAAVTCRLPMTATTSVRATFVRRS